MKLSLIILFFLFSCYCFGQNDIKLEIVNDTISKTSYFDQNNIVYSITNLSNKNYALIFDSSEFNESMEYAVEPFFIGLPDYYVYDNNTPLPTAMSFHIGTNKLPQGTHSKAFGIFLKENRKRFNNNISDITAAYRVSKCILYLKAGEKKIFTTQVDFPGYKGRAFDMKNKSIYYFQISLNSPKDLISQYYTKEKRNKKNDYTVFTGQIFSNKVPLIYHMYGQH